MFLSELEEERFLSFIEKTEACWEWQGGKLPKGYGSFWLRKKNALAHRVSYQQFVGPIEEGLMVCHRCDNPSCVNPSHFFVGTAKDNSRDRSIKGRGRTNNQSGQLNTSSKLTNKQVKLVRVMYRTSKYTQSELARKFKVSPTTMHDIVHNKVYVNI